MAYTRDFTMWYWRSCFRAVELFARVARVVGFIFAKAAFVGPKTVKLPEWFKVFVRFAFVSKPANVERVGLLAVSRAIVRFV